MITVNFDYNKLNKTEKHAYDQMNDAEKANYEKIWIQIEMQKLRLEQCRVNARERNQRERKVLAEKERKERTHRLIERGLILESYIDSPTDFSNDQIKIIISKALNTDYMRHYIAEVRLENGNVSNEVNDTAKNIKREKKQFF